MALFGEVVLIAIGVIVLLFGSIIAYAAASFSGKGAWLILVAIAAGVSIIWFAGHFGPLSIVLK